MKAKPRDIPAALSVAGSDSGGGAGIQADLLTFAALGVFGTTAITCATAQNPGSVSAIAALPADMVHAQADQVFAWFPVRAWKTGMLYDCDIIQAAIDLARAHPGVPLVCDPVMVATSGARLLRPEAMRLLTEGLMPLARVTTPNLDEAEWILGWRAADAPSMERAARELSARTGNAVLLKGGHLGGDAIFDVLCEADGACLAFHSPRIPGIDTHGSGCTLSAAIAAHLALGHPLPDAVARARDFLLRGLRHPVATASHRYISHRS